MNKARKVRHAIRWARYINRAQKLNAHVVSWALVRTWETERAAGAYYYVRRQRDRRG